MDHWLVQAAAREPSHPALVTPAGELSYLELERQARRAATALRAAGVAPGDRVALALPPSAELIVALHACFLAGASAVPIDLRLAATEQERRAAGAALIVRAPLTGRDEIAEATPLRLDAVATMMHTSGTTAAPKQVALTFGNWLAAALGSAVALGLDPNERWLCPMPPAHVGGLSIPIRSAIYATTAVLHDRFDTSAVLATLMNPAQGITLVSLVPTMLARLLDAGLGRSPTLRWVLLGGGPLAPALLERARAAGLPVAPTYGMTEACSQIATHGWPLAGVELALGPDGEVLVRGPTVAPGSVAADGWLHTGDRGAFDVRGRLEIISRIAETIVSGGENIAPGEVEAALLEHPAVADAAAFGRPHPEWGEAVVARVVLRDGDAPSAGELQEHCRVRLATFKVPKEIEFVKRLPRTESGKLLRREL